MDRRWGGALVLVVAVIAALAGNARTKHLAGDAERGPVPGPPHVGDCLLESPGSVHWGTFDGDQSSADPPGGMAAYPSLRLGDCATRRFGEVAGVVADGSDRRRTYQEAWGDPTSPESTCSALIDAYLGTPQVSAAPPTWSPAPYTALVLVGPSDLQRADGQHWLGCVAAGVDGTGNPAAYTGSVRGTLRSLRFPSQLAECLERQPSTAGVTAVGCDRPHKAELLAIGYSDAKRAVDTDDADLGCADLARSMTGLADPAAVGWLRVRTLAVQLPPDPNTADSSTANPTQWYCTIEPVGDHVLTGPVLGLGDGPPPVR